MSVSICICTSGRPEELSRCLASIDAGQKPFEVVVSDDSGDTATAEIVQERCRAYRLVRYVVGPHRGLCANRNHVIRLACGSHVSLLDDDAVAGSNFVRDVEMLVASSPLTVFTGDVLEDGERRQSPTNPTFLGHFGRLVEPGEQLANINLNCNVIPRTAFEIVAFDESIAYGYEDTDVCAQLLASGWRIVHVPNLVNQHIRPPVSAAAADERIWQAERARFYTTLRRHLRWNRNVSQAGAFAAVAPVHLALHAMRAKQLSRVAAGWAWVASDLARAGR